MFFLLAPSAVVSSRSVVTVVTGRNSKAGSLRYLHDTGKRDTTFDVAHQFDCTYMRTLSNLLSHVRVGGGQMNSRNVEHEWLEMSSYDIWSA